MNENKKILVGLGFAIALIISIVFVIIFFASRNTSNAPSKPNSVNKTTPEITQQPAVETKSKPQQSPSEAPAPLPIFCGVQNMPEGTCRVIESIEQNGPKNNPLVTFDTSQLPDSAKIIMDRNSWQKSSESLSRINITIEATGKKIAGLLYIQLIDGTWKATGYTIS